MQKLRCVCGSRLPAKASMAEKSSVSHVSKSRGLYMHCNTTTEDRQSTRTYKRRLRYEEAYRFAQQCGRATHTVASYLMYCDGREEVEHSVAQLDRTRPEYWE